MILQQSDLNLIHETLLKHFSYEELEANGLLDVEFSRELRVQLAEIDLGFFCRFYLAHHFTKTPVPMHEELAGDLIRIVETPGRNNNVVAWPRGHGKTTWVTLGFPLWCAVLNKRRYMLIISDSLDQSKGQLATIKAELEDNERLFEDFGGPFRGPKWEQSDIELLGHVKISALGTGMKIRGRKYLQWRPDLIIVDDPEELKSVQSDTQREGTQKWFFQSVMRAGWEDTKVFVIGNFIHYACLTRILHQNPLFHSKTFKAVTSWAEDEERWAAWTAIITNLSDPHREVTAEAYFNKYRREMMQGASVAWESAYTYYELMVMRVTEGQAAFSMEMQNEPIDPSLRLFKRYETYRRELRGGHAEWLVPLNGRPAVKLSDCTIFGATDPSLGATNKSDPSAIVMLARSPLGQHFVLEADIKIRQPDKIIAQQNAMAAQYTVSRWGIESVQFQAFYATKSGESSMAAGSNLSIVPLPQSGRGSKDLRIQSLQPAMENGYILVNELGQDRLRRELFEYPSGAHDDGLDALEMCYRLSLMYQNTQSAAAIEQDEIRFATRTRHLKNTAQDPWSRYEDRAEEMTIALMIEQGAPADEVAAAKAQMEANKCYPQIVM